jgi:hypothetical protein
MENHPIVARLRNEAYRGFRLLPPGSRKGSKFWSARGRVHGRDIERVLRATTLDEARAAIDDLVSADLSLDTVSDLFSAAGKLPRWGRKLLHAARERAAIRNLPCDLSEADIVYLIDRSKGRCELTKVPFSSGRPYGCARRPFGPSLDRIEPCIGYTRSNCRLVCFAVNVALSDWGEEVFSRLAHGYLGRTIVNRAAE